MDWSHNLVPEGLGNRSCSFDLLAELCSDISLKKDTSYLHSRNVVQITATNNVNRSAYQDKCSFNT